MIVRRVKRERKRTGCGQHGKQMVLIKAVVGDRIPHANAMSPPTKSGHIPFVVFG
jgi:hypothetical protein